MAEARHTFCSRMNVDEDEVQAERQLSADIQCLAGEITNELKVGASSSSWNQRRAEIAKLRERIREMRDRHIQQIQSHVRQ